MHYFIACWKNFLISGAFAEYFFLIIILTPLSKGAQVGIWRFHFYSGLEFISLSLIAFITSIL